MNTSMMQGPRPMYNNRWETGADSFPLSIPCSLCQCLQSSPWTIMSLPIFYAASCASLSWSHALSILILPLLGFITVLWNRGHRASALLFTPVASTALMLIFIVAPDFSYAASYVLIAVLAYGLCSNPSLGRRVSAE